MPRDKLAVCWLSLRLELDDSWNPSPMLCSPQPDLHLLSGSPYVRPVIIIVMGVSGCGKSTVGRLVAGQLGFEFRDGDDFHPAANVAKMRAGTPLNDADRKPWLEAIAAYMRSTHNEGRGAVVACSALKEAYRDILLRKEPWVRFVHLTGPREVIAERLKARAGHFMPPTLLDSQFATLETPPDAWSEDLRRPPEEIAASIIERVRSSHG